ncbi:hypothetical protein B296_00027493 [Ensete ventricosum]|uniref:Uncharacterized protein n=1 Tax=Ensete ventricosum TaxID=4639 RepID=A0A426YC22_ENSVE|nr:hypothetical protein B296_00027493 [Ensete ventricosum]
MCLGRPISPLLTCLGRSFVRTVYLARLNLHYGPEATSVRGHPLDSRSASARPLSWGGGNDRIPNGPVRLVQAHARWTVTTTLRRKPRQPEGPGRQLIWHPRCR